MIERWYNRMRDAGASPFELAMLLAGLFMLAPVGLIFYYGFTS